MGALLCAAQELHLSSENENDIHLPLRVRYAKLNGWYQVCAATLEVQINWSFQ